MSITEYALSVRPIFNFAVVMMNHLAKAILISLLFMPACVFAQGAFTKVKGTLIFVAIGSDGIMMAVDSRLTLSRDDEPVGIADSIDKLHYLKGFPVCFEGVGILDSTKFVSASFREYNNLHRRKESFSESVSGYISYMKKNYKEQLHNALSDNIFIFAGFEKRKPYVNIWMADSASATFNAGDSVFECTEKKAKEYFGTYNPKQTCDQLAAKAVNATNKFVAEDKSFKAGKPLNVIMIRPNNKIVALTNFRGKKFYNLTDFEKAVDNGNVKVFMIKQK
jgi:hypothetical protein